MNFFPNISYIMVHTENASLQPDRINTKLSKGMHSFLYYIIKEIQNKGNRGNTKFWIFTQFQKGIFKILNKKIELASVNIIFFKF